MKFKTELHAHTAGVSQCAKITVEETVESYIKKGVSTLVIANHYSPVTFENMESASWEEKNKYFLSEYHRALEVANGRNTTETSSEKNGPLCPIMGLCLL